MFCSRPKLQFTFFLVHDCNLPCSRPRFQFTASRIIIYLFRVHYFNLLRVQNYNLRFFVSTISIYLFIRVQNYSLFFSRPRLQFTVRVHHFNLPFCSRPKLQFTFSRPRFQFTFLFASEIIIYFFRVRHFNLPFCSRPKL